MGVNNTKSYTPRLHTRQRNYYSEFSLASFVDRLSGRLLTNSVRSTYSVSRPWSRVSRSGWRASTLNNPLECVKTAWPVPLIEALFLPEFKINFNAKNDYETLHKISSGAYGDVYKVLKKESQEVYAMKIIKKSKLIEGMCINQVKDEVKIQLMCGHHPFILNSPNYWQDRTKLYIVSDFMPSGDLFELVSTYGMLPEELCKIYVAELASALDFLHNAGVIYRDLKPENVVLDSHGHAILIDFGLSKWLKYGSRTMSICGTLQYMAPEIFSLSGYGHAVDWWALGVLLCYLLTAKYPTSGNSAVPGTLPSVDISLASKDLLLRLLNPDPTKRLRSLLTLQTIPFFMNFSFAGVKSKKISPKQILEKYFPGGPTLKMADSEIIFYDFDSEPTLV